MQIKVFTVTHSNEMEEVVNRWLGENPGIEIHHVRQSESMNADSWSMTVTIFYSQAGETKIGFEMVSAGQPSIEQGEQVAEVHGDDAGDRVIEAVGQD
jgi:hypothetical protein